jgi:acyl carrier protein
MIDDIKTVVLNYIAENLQYRATVGSLKETDSLLKAGLIDSVGVLELVAFLEASFSIEVSDADVLPENIDSVAGIVAFVQRKLAVRRAQDVSNAC